ncbi:MAG: hypothetical protein KKE11_05930, partial [Gammaproteobacteria bacterium]|nr:hypothetical protein [Gammaproteobacteria bacterium]
KIYIICFLLSQSLPNFITNTAQLNESMKILTALRKYDLITPDFYTSFLNTIKIGIEGTEYHDSLRQAALAIYNLACEDKMDTKDVKSAFIHAVNFMFEGLPMEKK